jgi:hypothetical protein
MPNTHQACTGGLQEPAATTNTKLFDAQGLAHHRGKHSKSQTAGLLQQRDVSIWVAPANMGWARQGSEDTQKHGRGLLMPT